MYKETFKKMASEGHAEVVPKNEIKGNEQPVHYINHFTTGQKKVRVVYNGAPKVNGLFLNDMLHPGSMFLE